MNKNRGFTTIELVTVIIIVAILAVNILPRFDGTASYEAHTHRAQLISALRLTQQRAMQQTATDPNDVNTFCHLLKVEEKRYGIDDRTNRVDCTVQDIFRAGWKPDSTGHIVDTRYDITFDIVGTNAKLIGFDWLGKPKEACIGGCTISIESEVETLNITIESEGYIHGSL